MIPFVAVLVALACAAASARRVWFAANATALHPEDIHAALAKARGPEAISSLRALVANEPDADWERDLLDALTAPVAQRIALVNEQLTELDYRIQRWARVPRVCASIATSFGFMLATLVLRKGLADTGDVPVEVGEMILKGLVADALMVGAMGLIGTAFCIGAQTEAKRIAKARSVGADKLVERLEELLGAEAK
ncbi:MAG: hypothetical protein JWO86_3776 [Myxococcaceae bacterium]|nr:hypothetical protein [Myxococcaceae bacterium]